MASFSVDDATCEDKFCALQQWWQRHCKSFSEWFLTISAIQQRELILLACPDIPEVSSFSRQSNITASDVLLPEFSLEGMLASSGRLLVLFFTRRLTSSDLCWRDDVKLLDDLRVRGSLPSFSRDQLSLMDTPFVDPMDASENIRSLSHDTTVETRSTIMQLLESYRLIHAEVWLALKLRRNSIAIFIEKFVEFHQREVVVKPSPTYLALLQGELAQQAALYNEQTINESV